MTSQISRAKSGFSGRMKRTWLCSAAALAALALIASPAFAETLEPWWHLTSNARPTYLFHTGQERDEVQEITVKATGGTCDGLVSPETGCVLYVRREGLEGHEGSTFAKYDATHEELQEKLEGLYGPGNVKVSGGPGDEMGSKPYVITFTGELADRSVKLPLVLTNELGFKLSLGGNPEGGSVKITQVTLGKSDGEIVATAVNVGDANTEGEITIADVLPKGVKAASIEAYANGQLECSLETLTCHDGEKLAPFRPIEVHIGVDVQPGAKETGEENRVSVTGGGAPPASTERPLVISSRPTPFGVDDYELIAEESGGGPDTQAGSHPFQLTTALVLDQGAPLSPGESLHGKPEVQPAGMTKDLSFKWPPGLIGNPNPLTRCKLAQFFAQTCPEQSAVGAAEVLTYEPSHEGLLPITVPVYNMEPSTGEPARFAFYPAKVPVFVDVSVRTGSDYGVTVKVLNTTQTISFLASTVSVWGVPGESAHNPDRGACLDNDVVGGSSGLGVCHAFEQIAPPAFLQLPTVCSGQPLRTEGFGDSWEEPKPESEQRVFAGQPMVTLDGCNRLPFTPSIQVTPDGTAASSPTGMTVDVHVPQQESLNAGGLAESNPRGITVTLPEGVAVNPSGGDGLQACSESLVGYQRSEELQTIPGAQSTIFTPRLPGSITALEAGEQEPLNPGVNFCSNASKIGTATIKTPLLPNPVQGAVYLATQNANPFGSLIAMYLVAEDPVSGVLVKVAGSVHLSSMGQLTATFENSPQAPFEDAELHFFGGERAPLATPSRCGPYTTTALFTPWSGNPPIDANSTFNITSGPNGQPCPGANLPFSPSLTGGATNLNAGLFSPLTGTFGREDGEQNVSGAQFHLPPGLSGLLSAVKLCGEAQANDGTCGPESLIGETTVSAGVGSDPVSVKGGRVYITGPYHGAPFGLSVVDPVKAGPFDLEHDTSNPSQDPPCDCIVVRAKIEINPITTALTITTNSESEGYAIPHFIDGIPVQIKKVNFLTTRPGFQFNPTNCEPMKMTATIYSDEGGSDNVAVPFQVTNCALLGFAPKLAVSTSAKTSRADGESLSVKLAYPSAPFGSQANIREVKVELPKALPSRLSTLQKACAAAQFHTDPAGCPAGSIVGHAKAITPVVPVPLEGPAYFVSNGSEAFPNLIIVLQGYGVTIDLVADTFIDKDGVTSSTFKVVPDQPVDTFELSLPEGPDSALAANGNLCKQKLVMPTEFLAQNGAVIDQNTHIAVEGCAKHKHKPRKRARRSKVKHSTGARSRPRRRVLGEMAGSFR
jgi:hypothetical protein